MSARYRTEYRTVLLSRREKAALPFRETRQSVDAYRNLLYLGSKGVIPQVARTERVAVALSNDNTERYERRNARHLERASRAVVQQAANEKWLAGITYGK